MGAALITTTARQRRGGGPRGSWARCCAQAYRGGCTVTVESR
ncbi:hypothetical protein I546_3246 [Mycobacterium kansasii 732]|nr:hypothetical protein I546_3246 [Mycobacterium kansasii 732]